MGGQCQHLQIEALRLQLAQWEKGAGWRTAFGNSAARERMPAVSSGCPALDRILPENGFRPGTLVEWLSYAPGDGAATLAFRAAGCALRAAAGTGHGRAVVVVDAGGEFYPPAAIALGIEPSRLIVVHPGNRADYAWALDQALRCPAIAATVAWAERSESHRDIGGTRCARPTLQRNGKLDGRTFRRLQLAAEQGGGLGLLIRPATIRGEPSWANVRLLVEPLRGTPEARRRLRIALLRCRGGEQTVEVEIDDEQPALHQG